MIFTKEQIAQALDALPKENRPVMTAIIGQLQAKLFELKHEVSTDPINKPFELNPKFVAKCDEIGRSRRQFQ
jgi:small-conductance mechanosensitive channel